MSELEAVVKREDLDVGDEIGSGGQAIVYRLLSHSQILFKEYRGVRIDPDGLDRLIDWRTGLNAGDRDLLDRSASWPRSRVVNDDATVGVLIPEAPECFKIDVRGSSKLNEVQYLAFGDRARKLGLELPGPGERAGIIATLADLLELFDRHRIVHGDISFKNVLWSTKTDASTYLLDCDGALQGRHRSALPQVTTQHWTDPRVQKSTIARPDVDSDRLALGLLFFRTYFQVRANFTGTELQFDVPSHPPLNRSVDTLIEKTLHSSSGRSSASEWQRIRHLSTFLEQSGYSENVPAASSNGTHSAPTYGVKRIPSQGVTSAPPTYDPNAPRPSSPEPAKSTVASTATTSTKGLKSSSLNKPLRQNRVLQSLLALCVILAVVVVLLTLGVFA